MKLSRYEQETVVNYNAGEQTATLIADRINEIISGIRNLTEKLCITIMQVRDKMIFIKVNEKFLILCAENYRNGVI